MLLAPLLACGIGMKVGAVLLENDLRHVGLELDLYRSAVLAAPAQRRPKGRLENVVPVVTDGDGLTAGE